MIQMLKHISRSREVAFLTDRFDEEMANIAIRGAKNGGPTIQDVLEAMRASHKDAVEGRNILAQELQEQTKYTHSALGRITSHLESEQARTADALHEVRKILQTKDQAIATAKQEVLQDIERRESWPVLDEVAKELRAYVDERFMREPRRSTDPPEENWLGKGGSNSLLQGDHRTMFELILGYSVVKWIVVVAIGALIVFGVSYAAESCAMQSIEKPLISASATPQ